MTREHPMMECGHAANAVDTKTGAPVCVICVGIHPGAKKKFTQTRLISRAGARAAVTTAESARLSAIPAPGCRSLSIGPASHSMLIIAAVLAGTDP